jgi:hypothetical protein
METFLLAAWNIWKERNSCYFQGVVPTIASWKVRLKADLSLLIHRTKASFFERVKQWERVQLQFL